MRELTYIVPPAEDGRKLEGLLKNRMHLSAHRVSALKFQGGILLDGIPTHTDARVRVGQCISVRLQDIGQQLAPSGIHVPILYRDEDVLVIDKPAPMPSVRGHHTDENCLENAVIESLGCPENFVWRPVNRLDKGTSGLMAAAMNAHAHDRLQRMLHTKSFVREYLAVTEGAPQEDEGVIDRPIAVIEGVRRGIREDGKRSVTHYRVLQRASNGRALIRLRLETGRTHQIRVHLASLGCPITGDYLYGTPLPALPGRFALHAASLCFVHPVSGETLSFTAPLPPALQNLLEEEKQ
ncbi:MAG: RluA family pseudouridine synthase [Clostridia bacterium]|nr:RluA family pseudouridine synthase [Clostridia bacterium]